MVSLLKALCSGVGSCVLLFYFFISLTFAFVELSYGILTNSLGLISDSFHMFFDCTGLLIGICAAAIIRAQWRPNIKYTYGYGRVDTIAGLVNSVCLLFVAFLLTFEAVKRLKNIPVVKAEGLLYISVAGLCVNFLGIIIVYSNTAQRRLRRHSVQPQAIRQTTSFYDVNDQSRGIMLGVLLHVISDALGSMGVLVSSLLIDKYGWYISDPICALVISFLIFCGIVPVLRDSIDVLMQRSPRDLDEILPIYIEKIAQLPNVLRVKEPSFWSLHSMFFVASLRLEVHHSVSRADKDALIWAVKEILAERGFKRTTVEVEDVINFDRLPSV